MEQKENLLEQELLLTVVLPEGVEKTTVVHGRWVNPTVLTFFVHESYFVDEVQTVWEMYTSEKLQDFCLDFLLVLYGRWSSQG